MYASFLGISKALHLDIFHQPLRSRFFDSLQIKVAYHLLVGIMNLGLRGAIPVVIEDRLKAESTRLRHTGYAGGYGAASSARRFYTRKE